MAKNAERVMVSGEGSWQNLDQISRRNTSKRGALVPLLFEAQYLKVIRTFGADELCALVRTGGRTSIARQGARTSAFESLLGGAAGRGLGAVWRHLGEGGPSR